MGAPLIWVLVGLGGLTATAAALLLSREAQVPGKLTSRPSAASSLTLVGDSIGVGMTPRLRELLPTLTSRAVVGANTRRYAAQLPSEGDVIVEGHINDLTKSAEWTKSNLRQLFQTIRARGGRVTAVTSTPWAGYSQWTPQRALQRDEVNTWLLSGADDLVLRTIDVRHINPAHIAPDGLHLTRTGYRVLAKRVARGIL